MKRENVIRCCCFSTGCLNCGCILWQKSILVKRFNKYRLIKYFLLWVFSAVRVIFCREILVARIRLLQMVLALITITEGLLHNYDILRKLNRVKRDKSGLKARQKQIHCHRWLPTICQWNHWGAVMYKEACGFKQIFQATACSPRVVWQQIQRCLLQYHCTCTR